LIRIKRFFGVFRIDSDMKKNNNKKGKVLLFYPNSEGYGGIPNGIALLSGCLKKAGFETACFDTTFLSAPPKTHFQRQKHGGMMKADHTEFWGKWTPELAIKAPEFFINVINEFNPDLIAVSIVDACYLHAISMLNDVREKVDIPIIAGGSTVTMCPEMVLSNDSIDIVCIGEGEDALVELAECVVQGKDYSGIRNLWVKKNGEIIKNPLRPFKNMDDLPFQDWSIFDEKQFYKPYCGTFHRTGFFELARGCPFDCSFCNTASLRRLYSGLGKFVRTRDVDKTLDEVKHIKDEYGLKLIFFIDDNFLGMSRERFDYFCEQYKKRINLPFYVQTRSETVTEPYIRKLKEINVSSIGIGVEHGNEELRKNCMNRKMSNENLQRAFDIIHKYGIRTTANIIIGMPHEEERMFHQTIDLLRRLKPKSVSINYFQPYLGTRMRVMAIEQGYISKDHIITDSNTCLDMPQFKKERVIHYYENFKKYLDGEMELPECV
jgi:radical SAM superfamily enzyme YgiQ (UPF0313 family)